MTDPAALREQVEAERVPHHRWHDDYSRGWNDAIDTVLAILDADADRIEWLAAAARVIVEAYDNGAFGEWMGPPGSSPMAALRAALEPSDD
jgi:hypothetical protein